MREKRSAAWQRQPLRAGLRLRRVRSQRGGINKDGTRDTAQREALPADDKPTRESREEKCEQVIRENPASQVSSIGSLDTAYPRDYAFGVSTPPERLVRPACMRAPSGLKRRKACSSRRVVGEGEGEG